VVGARRSASREQAAPPRLSALQRLNPTGRIEGGETAQRLAGMIDIFAGSATNISHLLRADQPRIWPGRLR
jgi:hypothetical protein